MSTAVCLISSHGGHLHELSEAVKGLDHPCYWVTYATTHTRQMLKDKRHYFVIDPHLSKFKYLINAFQALWHLLRERPKVIISTGAGIAIPTMLLGKFLFRSKLIFIESAANVVTPSHTAKFMYRYADLFLTQWPDMVETEFPKAVNVGVL